MNVWDGIGTKPRGYKPKNNTEAPRTRSGQTYPGGKHMRSALKRLGWRTKAYESLKGTAMASHTKPGSLSLG